MSHTTDLRAISFDAMGTLFTLRESVGITYSRIAARHGWHLPTDKVEAAFRSAWKATPAPLHPEGSPPADDDRAWWRALVGRTLSSAAGQDLASETISPIFDDLYEHFALSEAWHLPDDTQPALENLAARFRLIVLSNFDRRLHFILHGLGIAHYFEKFIVSSEVGASKPHPRMFTAALNALRLPAAQCLHVGDDDYADRKGAEAAGMSSLLVKRPEVTLSALLDNLDLA